MLIMARGRYSVSHRNPPENSTSLNGRAVRNRRPLPMKREIPMKKLVCLLSACLLLAGSAYAGPISKEDVPDPLRPWVGWVLDGHKEVDCPGVYNDLSRTICGWPSELSLDCGKTRATFSQTWEIYSDDAWIELPGHARFWPQHVEMGGAKQPVAQRAGVPAIRVERPGPTTVRGEFLYDALPEWIDIPASTGIVKLVVGGKAIPFPHLDSQGKLWLRQGLADVGASGKEDRHQLKVSRLIRDEIPLQVVTRIDLYVSGRHRELRLGKVFSDAFIPMSLNSAVPAKIDADGSLLLQVKPGEWQVEITARHKGPVRELAFEPGQGLGVDEEVWVFESRHHLRIVTVEGVAQIDPQQTTLPNEWKKHAVYLVHPGDTMRFVEQKRGDPNPAPDQLKLARTLWLDFDGTGLSIRDRIVGTMTSGWRLAMKAPVELGRVALNGDEQLITRIGGSDNAGVEMRFGHVNLEAESRIRDLGHIPATGWDRDFHSVEGLLHLPPGWTLLDASGIDNITQTWLKRWSLMDLFLVLIISLAMARIRSWPWGVVALATLILISQETGAPRWIWLHILAAMALLRVVPDGKIRALIQNYRMACVVVLVLISLPFMVNQIKRGLYPHMERPWQPVGLLQKGQQAPYAQLEDEAAAPKPAVPAVMRLARPFSGSVEYGDEARPQKQMQARIRQVDPNAKIQTGPGIPTWQWNQVPFSWNGPVEEEQRISFIFISPFQNLLLSVARVMLLAALICGVIGVSYRKRAGFHLPGIRREPAAAVLVLLFCLQALAAHGSDAFPPRELLDELKIKLTEKDPPACAPDCASSPRMSLRIAGNVLSARMEIHSLHGAVAVPLPGAVQHWLPQTVTLDNAPVVSLYRDPASGNLWVRVPEGIHTLDLKGAMPPRDVVQLPLPLKPYHVDIQADGWVAEGLYDNGVVDRQLQFTRTRATGGGGGGGEGSTAETFQPGLLPSFLEITRVVHLDLDWQIETTVKRVTPPGSAIVLPIPLLEGESVTSDIRVENGNVLLNMAPGEDRFGWTSSLEKKDELTLTAADTLAWSEVWQADIGTVWHAQISGIPVIHHQSTEGNWLPEWRPWPGENVVIQITRPEGIQGQTHTIENTHLSMSPSQRIRNVELLMNIRSSRGGTHVIRLPDDARLQSVEIDGTSQSIRQEEDTVPLPLTPGLQEIKLVWRELHPMKTVLKTPLIRLGMNSVDSFLRVTMPRDRWILFCGGPYVGPAVLFWGVLFVILLVALALGRLRVTPLRFHHWALLCLGLTQASLLIAVPVVAWFLVLGYRKKIVEKLPDSTCNLLQVVLVVLSVFAFSCLLRGIEHGLLGYPNMQISGNGSGDYTLHWYQDLSGENLPRAWVLSVPLTVYRVTILLWALWMSFAFIQWLRWAWECFSAGGLWRKVERKRLFGKKGRVENPEEKKEASPEASG